MSGGNVFEAIRSAAAEVAERARFVQIDDERLEDLAPRLAAASLESTGDPAHHRLDTPAATLAFVVTLDAVNFGSGWFPVLRKPPGLSGYFTIATALRARFEDDGSWSARDLGELTGSDCAHVFGQVDAGAEAGELMGHFARSLGDLGRFLETRFGGRFEGLVEAAAGSASSLVALLAEMPLYRDVARYGGAALDLEVPLYKRAQITVADLALAFDGKGPGRFADLDALTIFADNLVPHVLRCEGVLQYAPDLARQIEAEELITPGSPEEIEIRAVGLHAVERIVAVCRRLGSNVTPRELDQLLWTRGQSPSIKRRPRHRARSVFY